MVATSSNYHYIRSVDIYPKCEEDILLAVGLGNGRVALTTFGPSEYDTIGYPGKEFGEAWPRLKNTLCWLYLCLKFGCLKIDNLM